jgi:hypothetical protein
MTIWNFSHSTRLVLSRKTNGGGRTFWNSKYNRDLTWRAESSHRPSERPTAFSCHPGAAGLSQLTLKSRSFGTPSRGAQSKYRFPNSSCLTVQTKSLQTFPGKPAAIALIAENHRAFQIRTRQGGRIFFAVCPYNVRYRADTAVNCDHSAPSLRRRNIAQAFAWRGASVGAKPI